jgi:hypothetical protein
MLDPDLILQAFIALCTVVAAYFGWRQVRDGRARPPPNNDA